MDTTLQWYPGHIAKLERELDTILKPLDVVVEVVDARIPQASRNPRITDRIRDKRPVLLVLNKADLADPHWTRRWEKDLKPTCTQVMAMDAVSGALRQKVIAHIHALGESRLQQLEAKGLKRRPLRTAVVGMPNVGKSTLINALIGKKKAKTGHRAGVTRTTQWIRVHPQVDLLDTPGLIPPRLDNPRTSHLLACVYAMGDAAFEEEAVAPTLLRAISALYPAVLPEQYDLTLTPERTDTDLLSHIARRRRYFLPGEEPDLRRTAQAVLKDFRLGKLGRFTLERPSSQTE